MIPVWRSSQTRLATCAACGLEVEASLLVRGAVYCPSCRMARRRRSQERANHKARMERQARVASLVSRPVQTPVQTPAASLARAATEVRHFTQSAWDRP